MLELLQCLQLSGKRVVEAQNLSNLVFVLYLIPLIMNRKCAYIGAFLLCEFIGYSSVLDNQDDFVFYVSFSALFSIFYWSEVFFGKNIKIALAYGIMVLFQVTMVLDAIFYPEIETSIYAAYEYIVVAIHIYIIIVLTDFKKLRAALGDCINGISDFLGVGYNLSFCYTCHTILNKAKRQCR